MARKTPQKFVKQQKEKERAQKAKEKMAKRHHEKKNIETTEAGATGALDETNPAES